MSDQNPRSIAAMSAYQRHDLLFRHSGDYVLLMSDPQGVIVEWNASAERVLGWTAEQAIGRYADLFFTPQDKAQGRAQLEMELAARDGVAVDERWHLKKDGSHFWALGQLVALRQEGGPVLGYAKILRDRTQERLVSERLRLTQEVGGIGGFELFPLDGVLLVSPQFCRLWGLPEQQTVPLDRLLSQVHDDDRGLLTTDRVTLPDDALRYIEYRIRRADTGEERWLARRGERIDVDTPQGARYLGLCYDITERKRMAASLADSEARFRSITHSIEQMVWASDGHGVSDFYNERWYLYTGHREGADTADAWIEAVHPGDRQRALDAWRQSVDSGEPYRLEYRLRSAAGEYRWFLARAQPLRDEQGRVIRWFGSSTDIQDIVAAREVLAMSREELRREVVERTVERDRLWQLTHDLMIISQVDGSILAVNTACTEALGWELGEWSGRNVLDLVHVDDRGLAQADMARLKRGLDTTHIELRMLHRDGGHRLIGWTAVSAAGQVYAVGRDVTALRHTEEQLRQAQKMEAVGQLTGGIAHDFNNLLTGIIGSLDMLQRLIEAGRVERLERYLSAATTSAQRAAALTQRLLAFSRRQALDLQPTDVNQLVASLEDLLQRTLTGNIRLDIQLASGLGRALTDANQLENAVLNLVINARDAMPEGGVIRLSTSETWIEAPSPPSEMALPAGPYLRICVADTGTGMTDEVRARAFDPFFTTKPPGQGTGLGLAMTYGYARQSNGSVDIVSRPGHGSEVCLTLPRYPG
jgi:PAS domain S-box-containing protein